MLEERLPSGRCIPLSRYRGFERIGEGTYGLVYRAIDKNTNDHVALKRILLHNEKDDGFPITTLREVQCLSMCSHPSIITLLGVAAGHKHTDIYLVFEYCEHDLAMLVHVIPAPFSESEVKRITLQLCQALEHLHLHSVIHRDLKLSNLLYNNRGQLKLADFGMARRITPSSTALTLKVVTLWYRCPEILLGDALYTFAADMWSLACILCELLLGKPLLPGKDDHDQLICIFEVLGCPTSLMWPGMSALPYCASHTYSVPSLRSQYRFNNLAAVMSGVSEAALAFVKEVLTCNPELRLTATEACRHEYLTRVAPLPKEPALMPTFPSTHAAQKERKRKSH